MQKKIPIGIVEYQQLKNSNFYAVDKTMMIKDFVDNEFKVTLITRPRRFGKSLNMSMMAEFFDVTKDSKEIFKDTKIAETEYITYMNKYPTIFISFADAKDSKYLVINAIKQEIEKVYDKYNFVFLDTDYYEKYQQVLLRLKDYSSQNLEDINNSLSFLMEQMERYYHKKVMLFIDEYDTPFIDAYIGEYYQEIKGGLSSLLRNALKGTSSLQNAMLTGIQRVAKESIFSGLNNVSVYTVKDKKYSEYFGFNEDETKEILKYYGLELNDDVKSMYDGYHIGNVDVYNPWSMLKYIETNELEYYWVNTSANTMIKNAMDSCDESFKPQFEELIKNQVLETYVSLNSSFYEEAITENLWGLFVNAGYVTIVKKLSSIGNRYLLRIPNDEVRSEFIKLTEHYFGMRGNQLRNTIDSLVDERFDEFIKEYSTILKIPSYHDLLSENSYHMLILGMCLQLANKYEIISNREEGLGRCDLILKALIPYLPSFILEFKYSKDDHDDKLKELANTAINQIIEKQYDDGLAGRIIYIGLAHCGKKVEMKWVEKQ